MRVLTNYSDCFCHCSISERDWILDNAGVLSPHVLSCVYKVITWPIHIQTNAVVHPVEGIRCRFGVSRA